MLDPDREAEGPAQDVVAQDRGERPGRHDPAVGEDEAVGEAGRDLLDVMRDQDDGARAVRGGQPR